jgi:diguanylate cyclase (GGDEF)-like protein
VALLRALDNLFGSRRLRAEHQRLMAENLEYLGVFSQYERVLSLFSSLSLDALADRLVEVLCLETDAHGGVVWLARLNQPRLLRLAGVGGLVRVDEEHPELDAGDLPEGLRELAGDASRVLLVERRDGDEAPRNTTLYLALRSEGRLLGIVRLTDKLDGGEFGPEDVAAAERLAAFASQAVANAIRFRSLERRSFRDSTTGAYTRAYFDEILTTEVYKAERFSRTFSLVRVELDGVESLQASLGTNELRAWREEVANGLGELLRTTDLLAQDDDDRFCLLLPETDVLAAAVAKRRLRAGVGRIEALRSMDPDERPVVLVGSASYPADGASAEALFSTLDRRIEEDRGSMVRAYDLEGMPFRGAIDALLGRAQSGRPELAEQMTRMLMGEIGRRTQERGLLFVSPGTSLRGALRDGLDALRGVPLSTEIVVVGDRGDDLPIGVPVTWVPGDRAEVDSPFLIYYGEGPPYALLREGHASDPDLAVFHSSDPVLVEHLAFQLSRDLGVPVGE